MTNNIFLIEKDTTIYKESPNKNAGAQEIYQFEREVGETDELSSYVLIGFGGVPEHDEELNQKYILRLYGTDVRRAANSVQIEALSEPWIEGSSRISDISSATGATYENSGTNPWNMTSIVDPNGPVKTGIVVDSSGNITVDITEFFKWWSEGNPNYGLRLSLENNGYYTTFSSETHTIWYPEVALYQDEYEDATLAEEEISDPLVIAKDTGSNYENWNTGINKGEGFGLWNLSKSTENAGHVIDNGSFLMFGYKPGGFARATRSFPRAMKSGNKLNKIKAFDKVSNYNDWSGDPSFNEGKGFENWTFNENPSGGNAGRFIGDIGNGAINSGFGLFSGGNLNAFSRVSRKFNEPLKPKNEFSVDIAHTSANFGEIGLNLLSDTDVVFTLKFINGSAEWNVNDGGTDFNFDGRSIEPNTKLTFTFTYEGNNQYSFSLGDVSENNFVATSDISKINGVEFFNEDQGNGENFGFNNFEIKKQQNVNENKQVGDTFSQEMYLHAESGLIKISLKNINGTDITSLEIDSTEKEILINDITSYEDIFPIQGTLSVSKINETTVNWTFQNEKKIFLNKNVLIPENENITQVSYLIEETDNIPEQLLTFDNLEFIEQKPVLCKCEDDEIPNVDERLSFRPINSPNDFNVNVTSLPNTIEPDRTYSVRVNLAPLYEINTRFFDTVVSNPRPYKLMDHRVLYQIRDVRSKEKVVYQYDYNHTACNFDENGYSFALNTESLSPNRWYEINFVFENASGERVHPVNQSTPKFKVENTNGLSTTISS